MLPIRSMLACLVAGLAAALFLRVERAAPVARDNDAPLDADVTCPPLEVLDRAVGAPLRSELVACLTRQPSDDQSWKVVAAARVPHLAVWNQDGRALLSTDGGVTFRPVFEGRHVDALAFDPSGTLFVRIGNQLGRLDRDVTWQTVPASCGEDGCPDRLAIAGDIAVLYGRYGSDLLVSRDGGDTWNPRTLEIDGFERMSSWRGALYALRSGPEPEHPPGHDEIATIDHQGEATQSVGWDHHLATSNDVLPSWTWRVTADYPMDPDLPPLAQVIHAKLHVVEGARELAVFDHSLVELCGTGGRQIYRKFPFDDIHAVDWAGRPLVMVAGTLLLWSPLHGWRELLQLSSRVDCG